MSRLTQSKSTEARKMQVEACPFWLNRLVLCQFLNELVISAPSLFGEYVIMVLHEKNFVVVRDLYSLGLN